MRASARSRNRPVPVEISQDIKDDIAEVVRHLTLFAAGGTSVQRAFVGHEVLSRLRSAPKLVYGSMLYRAGHDQVRDTMGCCGKRNTGYCIDGGMLGHVWNEVGNDLIDFSCGDWVDEAQMQASLYPDGLGDSVREVPPPSYLWRGSSALKANWREFGSPRLGEFWYGPWHGAKPNMSNDLSLKVAFGQIDHNLAQFLLRERLNVREPSTEKES
jgi:hypothetical protein